VADRSVRVELRGAKDLNRAFKRLETGLEKELRAAFREIARTVAGRAAAKVPRLSGVAAGSIKPRASQTGAGIAFGGSSAEYYPWLDFGGRVGRGKSVYRDLVVGGRYVYPTIAESKDDIGRMADEAIRDVAKKADFETKGSAD
jgi:hypothetical protein